MPVESLLCQKTTAHEYVDHHWVTLTTRKKTYFKDIGEIAQRNMTWAKFLPTLKHKRHRTRSEVIGIDVIIGNILSSTFAVACLSSYFIFQFGLDAQDLTSHLCRKYL